MYLNCHTSFSFKYGTLPPKMLFDEARRCNVRKLIITEINNTASYLEMLRLAEQHKRKQSEAISCSNYGLEIGVGVEFRNKNEFLYILIARNNFGFEKINRFLSHHVHAAKDFPARPHGMDRDVFVVYPFGKFEPDILLENEFIGVRKSQLNAYAVLRHTSNTRQYVFLHPVTLLPPEKDDYGKLTHRDYNMHRLLRAVANNVLLSKLPEEQLAQKDEFMQSEDAIIEGIEQYPELITNTRHILDQCRIDYDLGSDKNKKSITKSPEEDFDFLKNETLRKFEARYQSYSDEKRKEVLKRIRKELRIIWDKGFTSYYLIAYDLIQFARAKGYDFVGRGSGANSAVAYCLGITNVDPIELNLYFERFLNEERSSPPDFDIDFSWDNRNDIYDYLFQKYGKDHVCLLGTHVTYQWNSILRELAKVFGLPKDEIDALVENPGKNQARDHITQLVYKYASWVVKRELPANLSIHAGGVLITEKPIYWYTATDLPPKGYPVSHFDMHNAEDFGIHKFDILSQRGLGHIKETVKLVRKNRNVDVDINRFHDFKVDPNVNALIRESKATGCFYVESPAMRMLLGKLRCEDYPTLVAASSIIRPGVASSGMMRAYIERFHITRNGGTYEPIHPKMDELMADTYGVMVYQEDVIKVAHEFAGITLTEADILRRGMSGKYRSREEFESVKSRFFEECHKKGYEQHVIDRVWFEIESFSGYSFAKGHSASYAVESYQSLYLKAYWPLEFMVAVINNFGGFYKTEFYFHEARMLGGKIQPPCVNHSEYLTTIIDDNIYIGFIHLKGLETKIAHAIVTARRGGAFRSLEDFLSRVAIGIEQTRILIRIGAFRFTGKNKQRLLWEAMLFFSHTKTKNVNASLFNTEPKEYPLPQLARHSIEDAFDEIELLGFPLCDPFNLVATQDYGNVIARDLMRKLGETIDIVGYVVTTKDTRTRGGLAMHFGTFLDQHGEVFDSVHFPDIAKKFPFRGRGFYRLRGKVVEDFGVPIVEVLLMEKIPMVDKRAEEFMREHIEQNNNRNYAERSGNS